MWIEIARVNADLSYRRCLEHVGWHSCGIYNLTKYLISKFLKHFIRRQTKSQEDITIVADHLLPVQPRHVVLGGSVTSGEDVPQGLSYSVVE